MFIKEITSQSRRDFKAIYACEHCGEEKKGKGYDDDYFHQEVVPAMECEKCGEKALDTYVPRTPPAGEFEGDDLAGNGPRRRPNMWRIRKRRRHR